MGEPRGICKVGLGRSRENETSAITRVAGCWPTCWELIRRNFLEARSWPMYESATIHSECRFIVLWLVIYVILQDPS